MAIFRMSKATLLKELRDYVMIFIAMMSYCIGWTVFLLPNNITTGGVAGIASIVYWAVGIPVQWTYFGINAALIFVALKLLGYKFCIKTIYGVSVLTVAISIATTYYNARLLSDEPFMAAIIGSVFCGCGVGLGLLNNGSAGGTDIIAAIVNKYRDISLGRVILLCDVVIISCSWFVLRDWEKVIYGYVVLYVTAFCIDQVVNSRRSSVQFFIISNKYKEIGERINREPHRGCTVIDAQGFYSGKDMKMLFVLAKRRQSDLIFRIINDVDPHAFVSQSSVIGVYGEGFDHFKVPSSKKPKLYKSDDGQ
ncbi:MAG: YitT family protein [Prevotella sp.]|nr:YitT family protein [Prevotella sp.]